MRCENCGAGMRLKDDDDCLRCEYCESVYCPEPNERGIRVLGEPAGLSCSLCAVGLVHAVVAGKRVLYCPQCHGLLIDMELFATLVQLLQSHHDSPIEVLRPPDWKELRREMTCPQCGRRMDTHLYGGPGNIVIDNCERCSLNWLDDGELQRGVGAPDRRYSSKSTPGGSRR